MESSLKETLMSLQHYLDLQIRYNKLLFAKRLGVMSSAFVMFIILLVLFSFASFFLSFTFVDWWETQFGDRLYGTLIVFGFYLLIGLILFVFREGIIYGPIRKFFANLMEGNDDLDRETDRTFRYKAEIDRQLIVYRENLKEGEEILKEKFDELGDQFTLPNILKNVTKSLYAAYLSTSNIAKISYFLVKKIKSAVSGKKSKKERKEQKRLKDNVDLQSADQDDD